MPFKNFKIKPVQIIVIVLVAFAATRVVSSKFLNKNSGNVEKTTKVTRGDLAVTITATGEVKPQNRLEIKPPVAGRLDEILVREGHVVKKGDVLAWMSSTDRVVLLDAMHLQKDNSEKNTDWQNVYKPTPLLAPIGGTVIVRSFEPGQTVATSDAVLVLADRLLVKAQVDETDIGRVQIGQHAVIYLDAYPDLKIAAKVDHIAYESETVNNVIIYRVDVLPERVPEQFASGMTANVEIEIARKDNALLVPIEAVQEKERKKFVLVKEKSNTVHRPIEVGIDDNSSYEVVSGLKENDTVVIKTKKEDTKKSGKKKKSFLAG